MSKDVQEVERVSRDRDSAAKQDYWASHFLRRLPTPKWQTRQDNLPTLANPGALHHEWRIHFAGGSAPEMDTYAFEATPKAMVKFIGVVVPKGVRPTAWLIYFRHSAQQKDFHGNLLELGVGDYLVGRMQVAKQIALSGKNVGAIIPVAFGSSGEFEGNQAFVTQCLHEIETSIYGSPIKPALLAASNSDGIFKLQRFLHGCPALVARLKGIYDFDGSYVRGAGAITLAVSGARTFRYAGAPSPTQESWAQREAEESFLLRTMNQNPARVPLALSRWREHNRFKEVRPFDNPNSRHKKGDPENEVRAGNAADANWLHHHIPTCMLHHGLVSTPGI
jgi:hypothetical protein